MFLVTLLQVDAITNSIICDYDIEDSRDMKKGILENFFLRYKVNYKEVLPCGEHESTKEYKLVEMPQFLVIGLNDFYEYENNLILDNNTSQNSYGDDDYQTIVSSKNQLTVNYNSQTFTNSNINGVLKRGLEDRVEIENELHLAFPDVKIHAVLKGIIYFENGNHFTLAYNKPRFRKETFNNWCFYDDRPPLTVPQDPVNVTTFSSLL